jgi:hypothetical protein
MWFSSGKEDRLESVNFRAQADLWIKRLLASALVAELDIIPACPRKFTLSLQRRRIKSKQPPVIATDVGECVTSPFHTALTHDATFASSTQPTATS